jgi:hypothetical protein
MRSDSAKMVSNASSCKYAQKRHLLFLSPKKVAINSISGIITTNLGRTATHTEVIGRVKTDTSLQNMPFSLAGEGHFFLLVFLLEFITIF